MDNIYGVIAAGGLGTRLRDFEENKTTKVLIDINGQSMISMQIDQLYNWGVENFIVITNPEFHDLIVKDLNKNYPDLKIDFISQISPKGIADALSYASGFTSNKSKIIFVLGDNFFGNNPLQDINLDKISGAHIFLKEVINPEEFGVVEVSNDKVVMLHEKPKEFISSLAVVGLYIYDKSCFEMIKTLQPSNRGELEITDLNKLYMNKGQLTHSTLDSWWVDAGTKERIIELRRLL